MKESYCTLILSFLQSLDKWVRIESRYEIPRTCCTFHFPQLLLCAHSTKHKSSHLSHRFSFSLFIFKFIFFPFPFDLFKPLGCYSVCAGFGLIKLSWHALWLCRNRHNSSDAELRWVLTLREHDVLLTELQYDALCKNQH